MPETFNISSGVVSDRASPEDRVGVVRTSEFVAIIVADGAGGLGGGARAASMATEAFETWISASPLDPPTRERLCDFLEGLDRRITNDPAAGETTAIVAVVVDGDLRGASVGDSELWRIPNDGRHVVLTADQHKARLGSGGARPVAFETRAGEAVILAASDGLFGPASAQEICAKARTCPLPEELANLARSRSGKLYDDVGIVLLAPT